MKAIYKGYSFSIAYFYFIAHNTTLLDQESNIQKNDVFYIANGADRDV